MENTEKDLNIVLIEPPKRGVKKGTERGSYNKKVKTEHLEDARVLDEQKFEQFMQTSEVEEARHIGEEEHKQEQEETQSQGQNEPEKEEQPENGDYSHYEQVQDKNYDANLFNGIFLLKIFDFAFPHIVKKVVGFFNKKAKRLDVKMLRLDEDEKEGAAEIADDFAKQIFSKINPNILGLMFIMQAYGSKVSKQLDQIPDEE